MRKSMRRFQASGWGNLLHEQPSTNKSFRLFSIVLLLASGCTAGTVNPTTLTSPLSLDENQLSTAGQKKKFRSTLDPNQCIDLSNGQQTPGTPLILYPCHAGINQKWLFQGGRLLSFMNQCVGAAGSSSAIGAPVQIGTCDPRDSTQNWTLSANQIKMTNTTMCLSLSAPTSMPSAQLQLRDCTQAQDSNSLWIFENVTGSTAETTAQSPDTTANSPSFTCLELPTWSISAASLEAEVYAQINAARALGADCRTAGKMPPRGALKLDQRLVCMARSFAKTMSDQNFFSHVSPDGKGPFDRMTQAGVHWRAGAENIALGAQDAPSVVKMWLASDGHCADLMGDFVLTGIGFFNSYWVQDFATEF